MPKIGSIDFAQKNIKENQFKIKKKFGQNFLTDATILKRIVDSAEPSAYHAFLRKKDSISKNG
ncbi:MAG: hypothetical protein K2I88_02860, partial [Anaeroplasmataceae bacterium]|nr:hypothetical protein [Anaeroplasmataceae bacterium]